MLTRTAMTLLVLTAACEPLPGDPPDDTLLHDVDVLGPTGWDGAATTTYLESWRWQPEAKGWNRHPIDVHATSVRWHLEKEDGSIVKAGVSADTPDRIVPAKTLTPGEWLLYGTNDGLTGVPQPLTISSHGQVPDFDRQVLSDRVQSFSMGFDNAGNIVRLQRQEWLVQVHPLPNDQAQVQIWTEGKQVPWCRAWQGEAHLDDRGLLTAHREEVAVGGTVDTIATDASLRMGFDQDGDVAGVELRATFDTRALDFAFTSEGEPREGAVCDTLDRLNTSCVPCNDSGEPFCFDYVAYAGLADDAVQIDPDELQEAPPCAGPSNGELGCSTLGTVGISAWMLGVLGLLIRKRSRRKAR